MLTIFYFWALRRRFSTRCCSLFCSSGFYEGFQLETMDDHRWLELFMPSPQQRGLGMPEKPRQIRSPLSAKSWRPSASEFFTPKAVLVRQCSWRNDMVLAESPVQTMTSGFQSRGYVCEPGNRREDGHHHHHHHLHHHHLTATIILISITMTIIIGIITIIITIIEIALSRRRHPPQCLFPPPRPRPSIRLDSRP